MRKLLIFNLFVCDIAHNIEQTRTQSPIFCIFFAAVNIKHYDSKEKHQGHTNKF